jgi:hypothetical protein
MARSNEKKPLKKPLEQRPPGRDEIDDVIEVVAMFASPGVDTELLRRSPFYRPVRERIAALLERRGRR